MFCFVSLTVLRNYEERDQGLSFAMQAGHLMRASRMRLSICLVAMRSISIRNKASIALMVFICNARSGRQRTLRRKFVRLNNETHYDTAIPRLLRFLPLTCVWSIPFSPCICTGVSRLVSTHAKGAHRATRQRCSWKGLSA